MVTARAGLELGELRPAAVWEMSLQPRGVLGFLHVSEAQKTWIRPFIHIAGDEAQEEAITLPILEPRLALPLKLFSKCKNINKFMPPVFSPPLFCRTWLPALFCFYFQNSLYYDVIFNFHFNASLIFSVVLLLFFFILFEKIYFNLVLAFIYVLVILVLGLDWKLYRYFICLILTESHMMHIVHLCPKNGQNISQVLLMVIHHKQIINNI